MGPLEVFLLIAFGLYIWALVVAFQKGHIVLFVIGLIFVPAALIGALIPAKPTSSWARRRAVQSGLSQCPACQREVSPAAASCVHCGHPLAPAAAPQNDGNAPPPNS